MRTDHYEIGDEGEVGTYGLSREEIGVETSPLGDEHVGAEQAAAVRRVIEVARDSRSPAPRMRAVPLETALDDELAEAALCDWFSDVAVAVGVAVGAANPFPIFTKYLQRCGAGQERPRIVRVDDEESYRQFRCECSPEMVAFREELARLSARLEEHARDPDAHEDLLVDVDDVEAIGASASQAEQSKEVELWLPEWARGKIWAWREGDCVLASVRLPGLDGEVRICTAATSTPAAVAEMEGYVADAGVDAATVVGVVPAMGCVLGAGTLVKEIAAAAPSLLQVSQGKPGGFCCKVEPAASPTLCAFFLLAQASARGDAGARAEWDALASAAGRGSLQAAKAMREASNLFVQSKSVVGAE